MRRFPACQSEGFSSLYFTGFFIVFQLTLCFFKERINSNLGSIIRSAPAKSFDAMPGNVYELCDIELTKGIWLLIGYTLACGNLYFSPDRINISRDDKYPNNTTVCFGLSKVPDAGKTVKLRLDVLVNHSQSVVHNEIDYCGICAIHL